MNLVFFGGSITWEAGASRYENSYAFQVVAYLRRRLPGVELDVFNTAISGTGTALGIFRLEQHVLRRSPDIIFIEFAVNDSTAALTDDGQVTSTLDYILGSLIRSNPRIRIVMLYSTMEGWQACSRIHEEVARRYAVPSIDIQEHFRGLIESLRYGWRDLMADAVHPSDLGHQVYAQCVIGALEQEWDRFFAREHVLRPEPMKYGFGRPRLAGLEGVRLSSSWELRRPEIQHLRVEAMKVERALFSDTPGSHLEYRFTGTSIGLCHSVDRGGGTGVALAGFLVD